MPPTTPARTTRPPHASYMHISLYERMYVLR
jgi:hypothetical protein